MTNHHYMFDCIPFHPDITKLKSNRFFHRDSIPDNITTLWSKASSIARPKAMVLPVSIVHDMDGHVISIGDQFVKSKLLDNNLKDCHRAFVYVATCGKELASIQSKDSDESSALFFLRFMAVKTALKYSLDFIASEFDIHKYALINPGSLPTWPLSEQKKIFAILGCVKDKIGVVLNDNMLMSPTESSSGIMYESDIEYRNCMLCTRKNCVGRRAPYNSEMAKKYE